MGVVPLQHGQLPEHGRSWACGRKKSNAILNQIGARKPISRRFLRAMVLLFFLFLRIMQRALKGLMRDVFAPGGTKCVPEHDLLPPSTPHQLTQRGPPNLMRREEDAATAVSLDIIQALVPETMEDLQVRYQILCTVRATGPIGRRGLAALVSRPERTTRDVCDCLRELGLMEFSALGMSLTPAANTLLTRLETLAPQLLGQTAAERALAERLHVSTVRIAPNTSENPAIVLRQLGQAGAGMLGEHLADGMILAVTGGTTMAAIAQALPTGRRMHEVLVVPSRGGAGSQLELQANAVAAQMAHSLGATYRLLHTSDVTPDMVQATPHNRSTLKMLHSADILVYGIGTVSQIRLRRSLFPHQQAQLAQTRCIAETLGYYLDAQGQALDLDHGLLSVKDLLRIPLRVAIAGGAHKAGAIAAACAWLAPHILVTDQTAAQALLAMNPAQGSDGPT